MSDESFVRPTAMVGPAAMQGLEQLLRAFRYAESIGADPWFFASEGTALERTGLLPCDLRWLLAAGYALHADELTHSTDQQRRFGPTGLAAITRLSCFVLTRKGADALAQILGIEPRNADGQANSELHREHLTTPSVTSALSDCPASTLKPHWDRESRMLRLGAIVIKHFKVPARNQELLLSAFQEQDWPHGIDDPLVPVADQNPKERLKAAIRCLNRNQLAPLIRFRGNGNGMRIYWERV